MTEHIKRHCKQLIIFTIISFTLLFQLSTFSLSKVNASSSSDNPTELITEHIEGIVNWKKQQITSNINEPLLNNTFLENAGKSSVDWYTIGLGRIGLEDDYAAYLAVIKDNVEKRYQTDEKLSAAKATEWHRISLAILASGGDPTKVGKDENGEPIDLIKDGTYDRGKDSRPLGAQGVNGWIWGLITLDSMRYVVPDDAQEDRKSIITEILSTQLTDGGFSLHIDPESNVDITAMAVQALAPYYNDEQSYTYTQIATEKKVTKTVREVVDEAVQLLAELQLESGDYALMDMPNVESTAQVIVALTSLGIDPLKDERFIKNGRTLLDGLLNYQMADGGFVHSKVYDEENPTSRPDESNPMASEQVLYTLVAMYRYYEGYRSLYDFRSEMSADLKKEIDSLEQAIETIPKERQQLDKKEITTIFEKYLQLPIEERSYVYNYFKLAEVMERLGIENTSESIVEHIGINEDGKGTIEPLLDKETTSMIHDKFTEENRRHVETLLKEEITTEHFVEVVKLIEQLETAKNKAEYAYLQEDLQKLKEQIEQIDNEIKDLNQTILDELYPFNNISTKDKEIVNQVIERYEQLSAYDQAKVQGFEDVEKAEAQINSLVRAKYITVIISVLIIVMGVVLVQRYRKRKREKMKRKMIVDEEA